MTFRGSFERDIKEFAESDAGPEGRPSRAEDDDAIETIVNERFYHRPEMFYSPDKLVISYGVPAPTPAFVYNAFGKRPLPTKDEIVADTVDSIAARFNLRYNEQKWVNATAQLVSRGRTALLSDFIAGDYDRSSAAASSRTLGGLHGAGALREREAGL